MKDGQGKRPRVHWSDRLERLAEGMFACWEREGGDPFARTCVVVGDVATRNWLQSYFLLHRKGGRRRILANVDFRPIGEFVNGWLAAMAQSPGAGRRSAAEHPYSRDVLAWRISAILKNCAGDPDFAELAAYVRGADGRTAARRRHNLAVRLAELYDDYLGARFRMLVNWERGLMPAGHDRWQAALYRRLLAECPETYTRDFDRALAADADPAAAFERGFPRYAAVHVFDVMAMPWPYLMMLERVAAVLPVRFWQFNPSRAYWLEDPTKRELLRERARALRTALLKGETPPEETRENLFDSPDHRLLGSLAEGARGMLSAELDLDENGCEWLDAGDEADFATLRESAPEVHVCHTPRRELEAAKDALQRFFAENPSARLCDAAVLCADWEAYAPLAEAVFGSGGAGSVPVCLDGGVREETPISHSLGELLGFRDNRFEVNAVFALLGVPEIRSRFGIDSEGLAMLRDMVRGGNIHWGYDDADVRAAIGSGDSTAEWHFTWRRGLDRFIADALLGPRGDGRALVDLGGVGRLLPCGEVEDERARLVGRLDAFVTALADLRGFLLLSHTAERWRDRLLQAIGDFYAAGEESEDEILGLRRAVLSVANSALIAQSVAGSKGAEIEGEAFCRAVQDAVRSGHRRVSPPGDAVRFAPLSVGTAAPARFVWICGLNDGDFPSADCRPSFDLIGRHPTMFDVTARARDSFALLKAAMCARGRLAFSYLGRNARTNEEKPAAVPLLDLLDWFAAEKVPVATYRHPLQPFSARYFTAPGKPELALPPSYSAEDRAAAVALSAGAAVEDSSSLLVPFACAESGETVIDVDDLAEFFTRPNHYLARDVAKIRLNRAKYDRLSDADEFKVTVSASVRSEVLLGALAASAVCEREPERMVEEGTAPSAELAAAQLSAELDPDQIKDFQSQVVDFAKSNHNDDDFACPDEPLAKRYLEFRAQPPEPCSVLLDVDGHAVRLCGTCRPAVKLKARSGKQTAHVFEYAQDRFWDSDAPRILIRHLFRVAAGKDWVTVRFTPAEKKPKTLRPPPTAEAKSRLVEIVRLAMRPMKLDLSRTAGEDKLPEEYAAAVNDSDICHYKGKRKKG